MTGGIHLDGFMDTKDALNSYGSREEKLRILKDSRVGAFAVIRLALYLLIFLAAAAQIAASGRCSRAMTAKEPPLGRPKTR